MRGASLLVRDNHASWAASEMSRNNVGDAIVGIVLGLIGAAAVAALLGSLAGSRTPPKCPVCGAFVSQDKTRCGRCGSSLRWT